MSASELSQIMREVGLSSGGGGSSGNNEKIHLEHVLVLPTVNSFHVESVAEDEVETFVDAQIGQPVPAEHAFHANHEPVTERLDRPQKVVRLGSHVSMQTLVALAIEDAQIHLPCVQIDAAIEFVLLIVESHHGPPWEVVLEPRNHPKAVSVF